MTDDLVVITGGPGSGKSTLIDALALEGFSRMPEGGRAIIRDQVAIGGQALPRADRVAFSELMLAWDLWSYREAQALPAPIIFDRGIPDVVGYLTLCGLPVQPHVRKAAQLHRYRRQVFIAPVWPDIFIGDAERKQSLAEARATYRVIAATYADLGYEPVHLPLVSVAERVDFVRQRLG